MDNAARHHFSNDPIVKLIREIIQNSLDARIKDMGLPALVEFHDDYIPTEKIGGDILRTHINQCYERTKKDTSAHRLETQYETAYAALDTDTIRCLRIVDKNTSGLKEGKFHALVRQEGGVDKDTGAPGGSYGIGKNAPFNVSSIKTVFYSTTFWTKRGRHEQMEGKTLLIPHDDPFDNAGGVPEKLQHAGYYRNKYGANIEGKDIDRYFHLNDFGTGVYIMGFDPKGRDWIYESTNAILSNFAYSIRHGFLEVKIESNNDVKDINKRELEQRFEEQKQEAKERKDQTTTEKLEKAYDYYTAYRDSLNPNRTQQATPLGEMYVWINSTSGPKQTIYINRNGMSITDARADTERNPFGPRNKQIWPSYAAVVMPADDKTDEQVRKMENPSHDQINLQGLETEKERNRIKLACANIRSQIANFIEEATGVAKFTAASNAEEMSRFVPEQTTKAETSQPALFESTPIKHTTVEQKIIEIQEGKEHPGPPPKPRTIKGQGPTAGNGKPTTTARSHAQAKNPRVIRSADQDDMLHAIFTPMTEDQKRGTFQFMIRPTGNDNDGTDQPLLIKTVSSTVESTKVKLLEDGTTLEVKTQQGNRIAIRIQAKEPLGTCAYQIAPVSA